MQQSLPSPNLERDLYESNSRPSEESAHDTHSLVQAMRRVLTDDELRDNMVRKGLEQSKKFSWEKTAELTLQVYNRVEMQTITS